MLKGFCLGFLMILGLLPAGQAQAFPELTGLVIDEADILSDEQEKELAKELEKAFPYQVVAVSLRSTEGYSLDDYACKLHDYWQLTNTVMVLFAPNQKRLGTHASHDLENLKISGNINQIVGQVMIPLAKKRQYDSVLIEGGKAVVAALNRQEGKYRKTAVNDMPKQSVSSQKESFLTPEQKKKIFIFLEPFINLILMPFGAKIHGIENMDREMFKTVFLFILPFFFFYLFRRKKEPVRQQKAIVKREDWDK